MTFVAAKRFGNRIIVVGDTMISDLHGTRHSAIPGQLKIIVLSPTLTVAFAGLVDQALDAIRAAKRLHLAGTILVEIERMLAEETVRHAGRVEFLVISHSNGEPALKRVWDGRISSGLTHTCIGERDLLPALLARESEVPLGCRPHEFEQEGQFSAAFHGLFDGTRIIEGVGGLPIMVTCSPYGHCYNAIATSKAWDKVSILGGVTEQQLADRRTGMTEWSFNIQATQYRGVAILGAIMINAGVGYIYSPLENDEPLKWIFPRPTDRAEHGALLEQFQAALEERAEVVGGGLIDDYAPGERHLTDSELEEVIAYAAAAPMPTQIIVRADGLWIECGQYPVRSGALVGFQGLESEPMSVIKTMIDRMNAEMTAVNSQLVIAGADRN